MKSKKVHLSLLLIFQFCRLISISQTPKAIYKDSVYHDASGNFYPGTIYENALIYKDSLFFDNSGKLYSGDLLEYASTMIDSSLTTFEEGKTILRKTYFKSGKPKSIDYIKQGVQIQYYENGSIFILSLSKNGLKEGRETMWSENGTIKSIDNYHLGKRNGLSESFYDNGHYKIIF